MDAMCLKTGIHAIPPSISVAGSLDARPSPAQVSTLGRSPLDKSSSAAAPSSSSSSSRFSFGYPLKSLWFGGGGGGAKKKHNGIALDDAVLADGGERAAEGAGGAGPEGQSGNWVLKILHVRSLWKEEEEEEGEQQGKVIEDEGMANDGGGAEEGGERGSRDVVVEGKEDGVVVEDEDEEECDACRIGDHDEKEIDFDRDSFSRLLRRVPLRQAKLCAQMSYLGNLAYAIPKIKVQLLSFPFSLDS